MVFSIVSFPFLHRHSSTPVAAICFGTQAFSHIGFGREKKIKEVKLQLDL